MADHLIRKKGESTWYVKLSIPVAVRPALGGKTVFVRSLKTGLRSEAMVRRLSVLSEWQTIIESAKTGIPLAEGWKDDLINMVSAVDKMVQVQKRALIGEEPPPVEDSPEARAILLANPKAAAALKDWVKDGLQGGIASSMAMFEQMQGALKALIPQALAGSQNIPTSQRLELTELLANPVAHMQTSSITTARLKAFREFREGRGGAAKHVDQQVRRMEDLSKFLKGNSLPLEFDSIDTWIKSLNRAPATLGQHLMSGTAFWKWATKYDVAWREEYKDKANPFLGHDIPQGGGSELAGQDREIYTQDDALKLRQAALDNGDTPLADLIVLGWYTGARIEELCRLSKDSVITVDGIKCFDFPKSKSKASKRVVPIHPSLISTVERLCKDSADTFLIPIKSDGPYGKRSHAISKAFSRLRTAAGFSKLHVFHSFRHTVVTLLIRADVPEHLAKELVGHETGSVTHDIYSKGASTKQKLKALSKLPAIPTTVSAR